MSIEKGDWVRTVQLAALVICIGSWSLVGAAEMPRPPAVIYAKVCGYCHGSNVGPVILGRHLQADSTRLLVRTGPRAMPAFRPTEITDAELDSLARWIEVSTVDPKEHGK